MKEYKKSYKGFVLWLTAFCAACFACAFFEGVPTQILVAILDNVMTLSLFVLSFIVYKTEYIYWYNGTSYEAAKEAGTERRKKFALEHMKRFGYFALGFLVYSVVSVILGIPYWIDIVVVTVGIVAVAIGTMNIKL